jgi:hypothetical protein
LLDAERSQAKILGAFGLVMRAVSAGQRISDASTKRTDWPPDAGPDVAK